MKVLGIALVVVVGLLLILRAATNDREKVIDDAARAKSDAIAKRLESVWPSYVASDDSCEDALFEWLRYAAANEEAKQKFLECMGRADPSLQKRYCSTVKDFRKDGFLRTGKCPDARHPRLEPNCGFVRALEDQFCAALKRTPKK